MRDVQEAARAIGRQVQFANAGNDRELEGAFATLVEQGATALLVTATPLFDTRPVRIERWQRNSGCRRSTNFAIMWLRAD